jgi:tRNA(adenine34) deaminase
VNNDVYYMSLALEEAKKAFDEGEVPVGAVLIYRGEVIAKAYNRVESLGDATAHAEVLCIREAACSLNNWRLQEAVLYCTLEPCAMCAGAMILSRVDTLVCGAPDYRHGGHGVLDRLHPIHQVKVRRGVLADESSRLMVEFFKQRRSQNALR